VSYPYHHQNYLEGNEIRSLPCKHCAPGKPCSTLRGTFDPVPGTDATMFIQWKGTEVCMDFHCECGHHSHIDAGFAYAVECVFCGALYEMGTQVRARKMTPEEVIAWGDSAKVRDSDDGH